MNKFEAMKAEKDGLDIWPALLEYAAADTPVEEIGEDDLNRMKWFGVFHRPQRPGTFMMRLRVPGGVLTSRQLETVAEVARAYGHETIDLTTRQALQLRDLRLPDIPAVIMRLEG
ncbi:MAG TPA: hypothetical protein PL082_07105, partial [Tepidiformaceae bacterium]|nr:hypothetical protein [Tepidiformaceae bacterium]